MKSVNLKKLLTIGFVSSSLVMSAALNIEWLEKSIDYGVIKEANGYATRYARFVNNGSEPVPVVGLHPSCGCTNAYTDKEIAMPGDTVSIYVTYDPQGRPGRIEKTTRVYLGEDYSYTLPMTGSVIATPTTLSTMYPYSAGPFALSHQVALLGEMKKGETRHAFINVYNQSTDSVRLGWNDVPHCLSIDASPRVLGPGDIAAISLFYNSRDDDRMANIEIPVELIASSTAGTVIETIPVRVAGRVLPDPESLTSEQLKEAPALYAAPPRFDLGDINSPRVADFTFNIQNQGKSPLQIYSVSTQMPGVKIIKYTDSLKSDKTGTISGTIDIDQMQAGPFRVEVEVISNDPIHPVSTLYIVGGKFY